MTLRDLSDRQLVDYIRTLERDVTTARARIESAVATRRRTLKIARATILTAGGLFAATVDLLAVILTLLGLWDWLDVVVEDATEMNRQIALYRAAKELGQMLDEAEEELHRRQSHVS